MAPFWKRAVEARLNAPFIRRSAGGAHNRRMRFARACLAAAGVGLWLAGSAPSALAGERSDQDRARAAVQAGEVMPLPALLERVQRSHPGQVLRVELERDDGRWIYELRVLQADGRLLKLEVDARSAEVLEAETKRSRPPKAPSGLRDAGYAVDESDNGRDAQHLGETGEYDVVVLDLGLPLLDGLSVLQRWRAAGRTMPVLILTARDSWHEKVAGIDAGADDYLAKPFHMPELLARLRALIRRAQGLASPLLRCGPLELDTRSGGVTVDGRPASLTAHEYRLLTYLMHRPGQVVSRSELTEHLYAQDFDRDSNTIEVFVARLRRKLPPELIETVRGRGYRLVAPA